MTTIIESQQAIWFIIPLLPISLLFLIAIIAETNRAPMDLPEAVWLLKLLYAEIFIDFLYR